MITVMFKLQVNFKTSVPGSDMLKTFVGAVQPL